jgi:predicted Rossmann fold nucleotide-binding protein DprA/Smf involved in DNA uptake
VSSGFLSSAFFSSIVVSAISLHLDELPDALTLQQARDRFIAGVADTIEVVQAQESVATASDNLISATHAHNVAKAALARARPLAQELTWARRRAE